MALTVVKTSALSGTITNAQLAGSIDLTSKVTGALPIANGGTALTSGFVNGGGITMADQWRVSAAFDGAANPPTSWERIDTSGQGTLGSAMTESSGVFSFPSTGIYLVHAQRQGYCPNKAANIHILIKVTINNADYTTVSQGYGNTQPNSQDPSNNDHYTVITSSLVDVTSTSDVKFWCGFSYYGSVSSLTTVGSTAQNNSFVTVLRLGDT